VGKGGRFVGLTTLPLHVPIVLKSGNFNLLEPSGPVKAYNGIDLLLPNRICKKTSICVTRALNGVCNYVELRPSLRNKIRFG
jgi:hypothetical protein